MITIGAVFDQLDFYDSLSGSIFFGKMAELFHFGSALGWFSFKGLIGVEDFIFADHTSPKNSHFSEFADNSDVIKFMNTLCTFRKLLGTYLVDGFRGNELEIPEETQWPFVSGYIGDYFRTVQKSVWISADEISASIVLSNTGYLSENYTLQFNPESLGMVQNGKQCIYEMNQNGEEKLLDCFEKTISLPTRTISSHSLQVLILK